MQPKPLLYVLVLNYNGQKFNKKCIDSLLEQDVAEMAVVFIDNGSSDGSLEEVKREYADKVEIIENGENLYFAAGNNRGFDYALRNGADYVFVLNNDTVCEPHCIAKLLQFMNETPDAGACQPLLVEMADPEKIASAGCLISFTGRAWDAGMGQPVSAMESLPKEVAGVTGGAMFLRARAVHDVGGFDESYQMYYEDVELSFRLILAKYKLFLVPTARVRHYVGGSTGVSALRVYFCERNAYKLVGSYYPPKLKYVALLLNLFALAPAACLLNLVRKRPDCSLAILRATPEGVCQLFKRTKRHDDAAVLLNSIDLKRLIPPISK
jgi:GT2 family glycosyltransferase